jgi:hypothetical protein
MWSSVTDRSTKGEETRQYKFSNGNVHSHETVLPKEVKS